MLVELDPLGIIYISPENEQEMLEIEHFYCQNKQFAYDFKMKFQGPHYDDDSKFIKESTFWFTCEREKEE